MDIISHLKSENHFIDAKIQLRFHTHYFFTLHRQALYFNARLFGISPAAVPIQWIDLDYTGSRLNKK